MFLIFNIYFNPYDLRKSHMFDKRNANLILPPLREGKGCIFAGAGVGIEAKLPGWQEALNELATHIGQFDSGIETIILDRIAKKKYLEAAEFYYMADTIEENKLKGIENVFSRPPQINDNLKSLTHLNIQHFITTNYDQTLEDSWSSTKASSIPSLSNGREDFLAAHRFVPINKPFVIHIHGTIIKPMSIVLCRSHYNKLMKIDSYFQFLKHLLMTRSILFIGFSFDDPALRAFMEYTKNELQLICERPSFALISEDDRELNNFLQKAGITPVYFKKDKEYSGLWNLINWLAKELKKAKTPEDIPPTENDEILKLKHNLASVYTHFKIKRSYYSIYSSIIDGIVHFMGNSLIKKGIDAKEENISQNISDFLHIPNKEASIIVNQSLDSLIVNRMAVRQNDHYFFTEIDDSIDNDLNIIVKSIKDRCKIRYLHKLNIPEDQIRNFIYVSLVTDGVRLAHSILTEYPIPEASLEGILEQNIEVLEGVNKKEKELFLKATWSLFQSPNKREAEILGTISRIAFLTDLSLHNPDLKSFNIKKFIQHVYIDTNILLPAICPYHPRADYYLSMIKRTQKSGIKTSVSIGFLEEIVSHRESAIDLFRREFQSREKRFNDYVLYNGSDNINVFLGGFSGWLRTKKEYDFIGYLKESAPYSNIPQLITYLTEKGIQGSDPIAELGLETGKIARWNAILKDWYQERKRHKAKFLLWHEAIQLEALSVENLKGRSTLLLTADKGFIYAAMDAAAKPFLDSKVLHYLVMPVQFSYYIDLDEDRKIDWRAYSRILWSKAFKERHEKYNEYFIDRILHEYEPKLVDSLPKILQSIQGEIERAPRLEAEIGDEETRIKEFKYLEDLDEKFYSIMNEEKEKLDLK